MKCRRPPTGWSCSRPAGHEGPCAATPIRPREAFDGFVLAVWMGLAFLALGLLVSVMLLRFIP